MSDWDKKTGVDFVKKAEDSWKGDADTLVYMPKYDFGERNKWVVGSSLCPFGKEYEYQIGLLANRYRIKIVDGMDYDNVDEIESKIEEVDRVITIDRLTRAVSEMSNDVKRVVDLANKYNKIIESYGQYSGNFPMAEIFSEVPDFEFLNRGRYYFDNEMIDGGYRGIVYTSLGCPYRCWWCWMWKRIGRVVRVDEKVVEEVLRQLIKLDIQKVHIGDWLFDPDDSVLRILGKYAIRYSVQTRLDVVKDEEKVSKWKRVGVDVIGLGFESLVTDKYDISIKERIEIVKRLSKDFKVILYVVMGDKGETEDSLKQLFDVVGELYDYVSGCGAQLVTLGGNYEKAGMIGNNFSQKEIRRWWLKYDLELAKPSYLYLFRKSNRMWRKAVRELLKEIL